MNSDSYSMGCSRRWSDLLFASENGKTRFCSECNQLVHWADSLSEARSLGSQGVCVALNRKISEHESIPFVGIPLFLLKPMPWTEPVLKCPIDDLPFEDGVTEALKANLLTTIGSLMEKNLKELEALPGISSEMVESIIGTLGEYGQFLQPD